MLVQLYVGWREHQIRMADDPYTDVMYGLPCNFER